MGKRTNEPEWLACVVCGEETVGALTAAFFEGTSLEREAQKCDGCVDERAEKRIQREVWQAIEAGAL